MSREWMLQCGVLYVPVLCAALVLATVRDEARHPVALLFSLTWQVAVLPVADFFCQRLGYWNYSTTSWSILSMPLAFHLGWVVWWGVVIVVFYEWVRRWLKRSMAYAIVIVIAVGFDGLLMPQLSPVLHLSQRWWLGEILLCLGVLFPGIALYEMTRHARHPLCRGLMISLAFVLLVLWVLPVSTMQSLPILSTGRWIFFLIGVAIVLWPGIWAVVLFGMVGKGTPIPFDPPRHLVTGGIYRWIANPMQTSILLAMLMVAWFLSHAGLAIAAVSTWVYSIGIARWSENIDLTQRFGESWLQYRRNTANWWPRSRCRKNDSQ